MSLIRLCRVGGDCSPKRVASLRCFSTMMPSMSSSRAMSVRSGVMGIERVARRTLVDILKIKNSVSVNFSRYCIYCLCYFFKDTSAFPPGSDFCAFLLKGDRADAGCRHGREHFQISKTLLTPCCSSLPSAVVWEASWKGRKGHGYPQQP